jgi:hypothetical protein
MLPRIEGQLGDALRPAITALRPTAAKSFLPSADRGACGAGAALSYRLHRLAKLPI